MNNIFNLDLTKQYNYRLTLCQPNTKEIQELSDFYGLIFSGRYNDTSEISFKLPSKILDNLTHTYIKNPNLDIIMGDLLIKLDIEAIEYEQYFIIKNPKLTSEDSGEEYLSVQCFSREYILGGKTLRSFNGTCPLFYPNIWYSFDQNTWNRYSVYDSSGNPVKIDLGSNTHLYVKTKDVTNTNNVLADTSISIKNITTNNINIVITNESGKLKAVISNLAYNSVGGLGILNQVEKTTNYGWTIGYVSDLVIGEKPDNVNLMLKYRNFGISEKSILDILRSEVKDAFGCIFDFDTKNKIINVYHSNEVEIDKGLYIDDENYLDSLGVDLKFDEIYTGLRIYGANNINIISVSPTGEDTVYDYSYYMRFPYMDDDLIQDLTTYNNLLTSKQGNFNTYLTQLATLNDTLSTKETELSTLKNDAEIIQNNIDLAIVGKTSTTALYTQLNAKKAEITAKQSEIDGVNSQIDAVNLNITTLRNLISRENNFTEDQLHTLDDITNIKTWQNENYSDVNDLYKAGLEAFDTIKQPLIQYEISIASLLDSVKCQDDWNKITLGSLITLNYNNFGIKNITQRLVSYEHDYDNAKLTVTLSNRDKIEDATRYYTNNISNAINAGNTININKKIWNYGAENNDWINTFIQNAFDSSKQAIVSSNQQIQIDNHGITCRNNTDNGVLKILNNIIAMSEDGQNFNLCITPQGVIAETLVGTCVLSTKLKISDESGFLTLIGSLMTIKDKNGVEKVKVGEYLSNTFGIEIYNDSGDLTMDGNTIYCNNIIVKDFKADYIKSGHLDASVVTIDNLTVNAAQITGTLNGIPIEEITSKGTIYMNGSGGLYNNYGGGTNAYKSLTYIGQGSVSYTSTATVTLPSVFQGTNFSVIVSLRDFTSHSSTGVYTSLYVDWQNNSSGTFGVKGNVDFDSGNTIDFTYVVIA